MGNEKKYLFDLNNFDKPVVVEPDVPPPPTFSEAELAAARQKAFEEGRQKGLADAQASRDQQLTDLVARLSAGIGDLVAREQAREQRYEAESVSLCKTLFSKAFPILNEAFGIPQVTSTLTGILRTLDDHSVVQIELAPADLEEAMDRLRPLLHAQENRVQILAAGDLETGSFRMKWKDGGALRDSRALAQTLSDALARTLAEDGQKAQDSP